MKEEFWIIWVSLTLFGSSFSLTLRLSRARLLFWLFLWKTRAAAHRIRDAGFALQTILAEERKLLVAFYELRGLIDPREVNHALLYLRLARDTGKKRWRWLRAVLLTVMSIEAFVLSSMVADAVIADGSLIARVILAVLVGALGGMLAGLFAHAAGERLSRNEAVANIRRWANGLGKTLADRIISLNQRQNIDAHLDANERAWNRSLRGGSLWPLYAAVAYALALGISAFFMRLTQFADLRELGVPDLPGRPEILLSLSIILIIFMALQGGMVWLAYATALLGRESAHALRLTGNGRFQTMIEVDRYLAGISNAGERIQLRLHEHITYWYMHRGGPRPTGPILDPATVLDECIRHRKGRDLYITIDATDEEE